MKFLQSRPHASHTVTISGIVPADEDASRFGDLLRRHRLQRGMTQAELAERALLSERTISDIERGLKLPQASNARRLADALGCLPS